PHWRRDAGLPARIDALLGGDRRLGSRDRRIYRELIYAAVRYLPWIDPLLESDPPGAVRRIAWLAADTPPVRPFRAEISGDLPPCPDGVDAKALVLGADPEALTPEWFRAECPGASAAPLRDALVSRAPLWLRLQTANPAPVLAEFDRLGWAWRRTPCRPTPTSQRRARIFPARSRSRTSARSSCWNPWGWRPGGPGSTHARAPAERRCSWPACSGRAAGS